MLKQSETLAIHYKVVNLGDHSVPGRGVRNTGTLRTTHSDRANVGDLGSMHSSPKRLNHKINHAFTAVFFGAPANAMHI